MKKTEGIIIKKTPRREADAIFTVYTKELGLVHFRARGVRKQESKLKHELDLFNWIDVYFAPSKNLPIITGTRIRENNICIKSDLYRLKLGHAVSLVLDKAIVPGVADERAWNEVSGLFLGLNDRNLSRPELENLAYVFCYNLLVLHGLMPRLADYSPAADFRCKVQDFFGYHFGLNLAELI